MLGSLTAQQQIPNADSVYLLPVVSAEWNYNLFHSPHVTVSGNGNNIGFTGTTVVSSGFSVTNAPSYNKFTTKKLSGASGQGSVQYTSNSLSGSSAKAYKVVTYMRSTSSLPIIVNTNISSTNSGGSSSTEVASYKWTKVETTIAYPVTKDSSFKYTIYAAQAVKSGTTGGQFDLYYTVPEIYEITLFDYQNGSLYPTESPSTYFRPGESYVPTGRSVIPTTSRTIQSISMPTGHSEMPVSPIMHNPTTIIVPSGVQGTQNPIAKNGLSGPFTQYKYFVSDSLVAGSYYPAYSAKYNESLGVNKIIFKFNTIVSTPTLDITISNTSPATSVTLTSLSPDKSGLLVLYWTGSVWTTNRWTDMPAFNDDGSLSKYTSIDKISLSLKSVSNNSNFVDSIFTTSEFKRMHLIEISPRLEIDITPFVQEIGIDKSLDNRTNSVPISSMDSNSYSISLTGIPAYTPEVGIIPIFQNESDMTSTVLRGMLRKNVKFYVNFKLMQTTNAGAVGIDGIGGALDDTIIEYSPEYIAGAVGYATNWKINDIDSVSVNCQDSTLIMQYTPAPDYVSQGRSVIDVITDVLDLAGFTDYDYDSLYNSLNNHALDISYYYCYSKNSTLFEALRELFAAYQIGAYVDEVGVLRFLSLVDILTDTSNDWLIDGYNIVEGGYSLDVTQKPGKVAMRYQYPRLKTSASLANVESADVVNSLSYTITTSNDIVWQQSISDVMGYANLANPISSNANAYTMDAVSLKDVTKIFNRDTDGFAIIEDEIVSYKYKEYQIGKWSTSTTTMSGGQLKYTFPDSQVVSVRNTLELNSFTDKFVKANMIGAGSNTMTAEYYSAGGRRYLAPYDVSVSPTGRVTNVQRGMFNTRQRYHGTITSVPAVFTEKTWSPPSTLTNTSTSIAPTRREQGIIISAPNNARRYLLPVSDYTQKLNNRVLQTYAGSFSLYPTQYKSGKTRSTAAGLLIGASASDNYQSGLHVEVCKFFNSDGEVQYGITMWGMGVSTLHANITDRVLNTLDNVPKKFTENPAYPAKGKPEVRKYLLKNNDEIEIKVVINPEVIEDLVVDQTTGEALPLTLDNGDINSAYIKNVIRVYVNGYQIYGWKDAQKKTLGQYASGGQILPTVSALPIANSVFGVFASAVPSYPGVSAASGKQNVKFYELHASEAAVIESGKAKYHTSQSFLTDIVQNKIPTKEFLTIQATPRIHGLNQYETEYSTPAAISVDVFPVQYLWHYFPKEFNINSKADEKYKQKIYVLKNDAGYSVPINSGFRAKMMTANRINAAFMLNQESISGTEASAALRLYTPQIIATGDPLTVEAVLDQTNIGEVIQIDSNWIQSQYAADRIMDLIAAGIGGFSKTVSLNIFGNPLIQVGDTVSLTYTLAGVYNQRYIVQSVKHSFRNGLETTLNLNRIDLL